MDTAQKAKDLAKEIRSTLTAGVVVPGEKTDSTKKQAWDEIEEGVTLKALSYLNDAYAAGKADGVREARAQT